MTILGVRIKSPEDRRDADISFADWLPEGDTIQDASAQSDNEDLVVESVQVFDDIVKVWIAGGVAGGSYTVTIIVSTAQGRIKSACVRVRVVSC